MARPDDTPLPSTVEAVVDLIRRQRTDGDGCVIGRAEAIALVEQYAAVVASEAAIKATQEAYDNCISVTDQAMSRPLASRSTDGRSAS